MQIGLIGATNVGKSTLFNQLINQHRAIVTDISGTTTDIIYHTTTLAKVLADKSWQKPQHGEEFIDLTFSDSPGLDNFEAERPYIITLIDESDLLLFVIDANTGLTAKEKSIHQYITQHGYKDKTVCIVNKIDKQLSDNEEVLLLSEYYGLGYDEVIAMSAKQGYGVSTIKKIISGQAKIFVPKKLGEKKLKDAAVPVAIVGKPNAGKSTLLNFLAHSDVSKVSNIPGTTRDYVTQEIEIKKKKYLLYDTAGIKKKSKTKGIEAIAYAKTIKMLEYVKPTVLFMMDGVEGLTHRDQTLLKEIVNIGVPLLLIVNKIDLFDSDTRKKIVTFMQDHLPFLTHAPLYYISAKEGRGVKKLFEGISHVEAQSNQEISTAKLNRVIQKAMVLKPPRFPKNKICKIFYLTQVDTKPYRFKVFINHKKRANFSFKRWIENVLRAEFGFEGCPIFLHFIERERVDGSVYFTKGKSNIAERKI